MYHVISVLRVMSNAQRWLLSTMNCDVNKKIKDTWCHCIKKFKSKQFYETTLFCRFFFSYLCLLSIGIGSWMFHMTLQYEMQLMDELPMVYACAVFVYCLYEVTLWSSRKYVISMFRDKHSDCILYLWGLCRRSTISVVDLQGVCTRE